MNGGAEVSAKAVMEGAQWSREDRVRIARYRPSWRERLGNLIAGRNPLYVAMGAEAAPNVSVIRDYEYAKEKQAINDIEGGMRFRIIPATNGKIIGYYPPPSVEDSAIVGRVKNGPTVEKLHLVKEGESLMAAIAVCLALDRVKSE